MWPNSQFPADLVTFTEEMLNRKLHFLCSATKGWNIFKYFRFIDSLCTFSNYEIKNHYNNIYPDELELKKENKDPWKASFLDFSVDVRDRKFTTELIDEKDAFPFYINYMPYLDSNIKSKIFYTLIDNNRPGLNDNKY